MDYYLVSIHVLTYLFRYEGEGMSELSLADRATIANMSPEYGATMGFFPVDHVTLEYLKLTGRSDETVNPLSLTFSSFLFFLFGKVKSSCLKCAFSFKFWFLWFTCAEADYCCIICFKTF